MVQLGQNQTCGEGWDLFVKGCVGLNCLIREAELAEKYPQHFQKLEDLKVGAAPIVICGALHSSKGIDLDSCDDMCFRFRAASEAGPNSYPTGH